LENKVMHGQYVGRVDRESINEEDAFL